MSRTAGQRWHSLSRSVLIVTALAAGAAALTLAPVHPRSSVGDRPTNPEANPLADPQADPLGDAPADQQVDPEDPTEDATRAAAEAMLRTSAPQVALSRRKGTVTGDGETVFVANRTAFRPRVVAVTLPPRIRGRAWVVVDLDTGRMLGKHGARRHLPQASTLKLLTALTAMQTVPPTSQHRVTRFEKSQICACAGLRRGARYERDTLLAGALLASGNDAAEALAGSHPSGRAAFYRAMNGTARRLGANDTMARNASGLTARGSYSSARDLVIILRAALTSPTLAHILAMRSAVIETARGRARHTVWRASDYPNMYKNSVGKSGFTTPAKNTLVVSTKIGGHRLAIATLGSPSGYSTSGARRLAVWASANFGGLRAVGRLPHS